LSKQNQSFEESIQRLEQIVRGLERGDIALDESLKLFQEGTALVAQCEKLLDEVEFEIKKIAPGTNGEAVEEEFPHEA